MKVRERVLYKMELHESMHIDNGNVKITRVPGGWIYSFYHLDSYQMNSIFVPYNNEFLKDTPCY